ncbi:sfmM2 [Symbiodinium natans]|uniref:SfmM2 protein n=1 Tax=Symbiodinium natans TaxID=878477 RepID=A0A812J3V9_9DINO|nr:sfmM2 [Symbiodinium natans]
MKRGYKGHFFLFEQGTSEETLIDKNPTDVNPGTMAAIGVMFDLWSDLLGDRNITHFEGCRPSHARLLTGDVKCCCLRRIGGGSHAETSTATARNALSSVSAGEPCIKIIAGGRHVADLMYVESEGGNAYHQGQTEKCEPMCGSTGSMLRKKQAKLDATPGKSIQSGRNSGITTLTQLNSIIMGHAKTQIILAGSHLGLFEFLHKTPGQTKAAIEKATDLKRDDGSTRPIDVLLLGTTSLGLTILDKRDKTYRNCQIIEDLFESGGWHTIADLIDFEGVIKYKGEFHFVESLRQDTAVGLKEWPGTADNLYARFPDTPGSQKIFYDMMNSFTSMSIPCLSNHSMVIRTAKKMLDVGGGAGHGAIYLAKKFEKLNITLWVSLCMFPLPPRFLQGVSRRFVGEIHEGLL